MTQRFDTARPVGHIRLHFADEAKSRIPKSPSAVEQIGRSLWFGADESATVERLTTDDYANYSEHASFPLADFFDLPGGPDQEVDLEGLAVDNETDHLWLAGSHSLRRGQPKGGESDRGALRALKQVDRYLIGSIEIKNAKNIEDDKTPKPVRGSAHAIPFGKEESLLVDLLSKDGRIAPFLGIPSKDNGFDIEGLAVKNGAVLIGLRGPVLRGWATILQIHPENAGDGTVMPLKLKDNGRSIYIMSSTSAVSAFGTSAPPVKTFSSSPVRPWHSTVRCASTAGGMRSMLGRSCASTTAHFSSFSTFLGDAASIMLKEWLYSRRLVTNLVS